MKMIERNFFALCRGGRRIDRFLFQDFVNAVIAWEKCDPGCEVVELDSHGRIVKRFSEAECRERAMEFRDSRN